MTATYISILLATGAGAGFASGLLGVGGGCIMVPVMYSVIGAMGFPDIAMKVALGTSLLVILPTAMSGAWRHNKKKAVQWKTALVLGLCGLGGGLAGSTLATYLPERALKTGFGGLVLAIAIWMGLGMMPKLAKQKAEPKDNPRLLPALGFPIGMVSGLTGLGGGALIVPALVLALDFPMHMAIGTSVSAIILTSLGGITGYIIHGIGVPDLLPYSIGYINLPMWLCLAGMSVPLAQLGAKTAHALPAKQLRYIFIALMVYIGLRMIGVFSWLGLPI
ncbi:MAG: sulfite exporter TauE/SafE family protein [Dehalococcoidia bacterium]|nr:sulfite exporter TauE/SafE family protein [Dehalococcoidia bacterium]